MAKTKIKKIRLNKKDKVLSGLVGGLAEYFNLDPTLLRILTIVVAAISGFVPIMVAYFVATMLVSHQS